MSPILGIWASQISGRLWEPQGAYDALSTVTVPSGGAASVTFAAIPQGYKHLQIRVTGKFSSGGFTPLYGRFNSDSGANYVAHYLYGSGSSATAAANTGLSSFATTWLSGNGNGANVFGTSVIDILDYANTSKTKVVRTLGGFDDNGSGYIGLFSSLWNSTSAISSITFDSSLTIAQHSQFTLYGVR